MQRNFLQPLSRLKFSWGDETFMKPFYKRVSMVTAGLALLSGMIAGCGASPTSSKDGGTSTNTNPSTSSQTVSVKSVFPHGITLVVGYGPGGGNDVAARAIQPYLQKTLGVPVVVQNMPGGGGNRAAAYVYHQKPNSDKFLVWFAQTAVLEQYLNGGDFDVSKFTPVYGMYGNSPNVLISSAASKYKSLKDLETSPEPITVGVSGVANAAWLGAAYLSIVNHVKVRIVPFSSGSEAVNAALGNSVDVTMTSLPSVVTPIKDGRAKGILEMGESPVEELPGVPDIVSAGGTKEEAFDNNVGIFGPPGMPANVVAVLDKALDEAEKDPDFIAKAKAQGLYPVNQDSQEFGKVVTAFIDNVKPHVSELKAFMNQGQTH
jgi:tripartite-type tricarboxylate transporter receptor subunit TctC